MTLILYLEELVLGLRQARTAARQVEIRPLNAFSAKHLGRDLRRNYSTPVIACTHTVVLAAIKTSCYVNGSERSHSCSAAPLRITLNSSTNAGKLESKYYPLEMSPPVRRAVDPSIIHGALQPLKFTLRTASRLVQPFCRAYGCNR